MDQRSIERVLASLEARFRDGWVTAMDQIRRDLSLKVLAEAVQTGGERRAVALAATRVGQWFQDQWISGMYLAATSEVAALRRAGVNTAFDGTARHALAALARNRLRLVQAFTQQQTEAGLNAVARALEEGKNPIAVARDFRDAIGLAPRQEAAVANFRRLLSEGSGEALTRDLRDHRFDSTIRNATAEAPLTRDQIDKMVDRYRERWLKYRAEMIARTEALRALNAGQYSALLQAVEEGSLPEEAIERTWRTARDERVRGSHRPMHGQKRKLREPFVSGNGNLVLYPGDESAEAEETIHCRCTATTELNLDLITKWDESKHPRHPAGDERGGEFAPAGSPNSLSDDEKARARAAFEALPRHPGENLDMRDYWPQPAGSTGRITGLPAQEVVDRYATVESIRIKDITRTQTTVPVEGVRRYIESPPERIPAVTRYPDGSMHVEEGHTRLSAQLLAGRERATVRVIRVDEDGRLIRKAWDESKHPRHPAGAPASQGGEFAPSGGASFGSFDWTEEAKKPLTNRMLEDKQHQDEYKRRFEEKYRRLLRDLGEGGDPSDEFGGYSGKFERAVGNYAGSNYHDVNQGLRYDGVFLNDRSEQIANDLDEVIARAPPTEVDMVVYRGDTVEFGPPGTEDTLKGFASTSTSPWTAHSFSTHANVLYEIKVPAGSKVLAGFNVPEAEVLLPHGAFVRTLGVREGVEIGTRTFKVYELEYLGVGVGSPVVPTRSE